MNRLCPICNFPVSTWISIHDGDVKAKCSNAQCVLYQRGVTGRGDRIEEAIDHLMGLALKFDHNLGLKRVP